VDLTLGSTLNDTQRRYLELVKSSASSLLTIINDILDVSRIEAGRLTLEEVPFELSMLLHDALGPLEHRALDKGLDLAFEIDTGLPSEMMGDPLRLRQIVVNLVGNAIKFTREGQVRVKVGMRRHGGARYLRLSVADTGMGIAPDKLERIFESFTQADASTTRQFGGTGLGLTISRRLAHLMGGRLWAVSEPGAGSVFHLELQWRRVAGAETASPSTMLGMAEWASERAAGDTTPGRCDDLEPPPDPACAPGVLEVLVVDDHAVNRFLATTLIRQLGHRVTCASSGAQALRLHEERAFDLMLLDIQMPEMSGLEVAQRVRERERASGSHCPIVALTAHAMPADRARSLAAGMDDHLSKPIDRERLSAILQLLSRAQLRHLA
jgi:CheY-like chemotaxis protein